MTIRRLTDQIKITADEGMVLRCGDVTAHKVYMPLDADPGEWSDEPEETSLMEQVSLDI